MIASYAAPRSLPKGCDFGKQAMQLWIASYAQTGAIQALDPIVTRLFKTYVRSRVTPPTDDSCEVVLLPGWALAEPHFPDGFRYYGRRGSEDELEDRPHYHSQLYSARAHKERADWSLIRSLKMFLPLDYGPPSARNVLPRSIVDLTRRMLSLRLGPFDVGPMRFGVAEGGVSGRRWRAPVDSLDALQNSMIESFDLGKPKLLPREAALPGEVGGYRTFRDVRVVGPSSCGARTVKVTIEGPTIRFFCRRAARVEGGAGEGFGPGGLRVVLSPKWVSSGLLRDSLLWWRRRLGCPGTRGMSAGPVCGQGELQTHRGACTSAVARRSGRVDVGRSGASVESPRGQCCFVTPGL